MKNKLIIVLFLVSIIVMGANMASAKSSFLTSFNQHYDTGGTVLDTCILCHTESDGGSLNPYGRAYSNTMSFTEIEGQDSDGDGFTNLEEINALTFPGDPTDYPVVENVTAVTTTAVITEPTVNETTVSAENTTINETQEQNTSESGNEENTETAETTTSDQQSPGFESIFAVSAIIIAFYLRRK